VIRCSFCGVGHTAIHPALAFYPKCGERHVKAGQRILLGDTTPRVESV
jgi:hypothetical protein